MLDKELFVEVKPGLSSFADTPEKVNTMIKITFISKSNFQAKKKFYQLCLKLT